MCYDDYDKMRCLCVGFTTPARRWEAAQWVTQATGHRSATESNPLTITSRDDQPQG